MESSYESSEGEPLVCERIGEPMPDIAGIGILLGFSGQALITLILAFWVFFLSKIGRLNHEHEEGTPEFECDKKRLRMVSSMLLIGNDVQMLTGTALMVTAFARGSGLGVYHTHLVYDTASFVGISCCAAFVCYELIDIKTQSRKSTQKRRRRLPPRFRATCVYAILYFILSMTLLARLSDWSLTSEEDGHCYRTDYTALSGAPHPASDQTYVAVTSLWLIISMFVTIVSPVQMRKPLLITSILQFPLHLYFMVALRQGNYEHLEGEGHETENNWDFGQTAAVLLLVTVIVELCAKCVQYYGFQKDLKRYGPEQALLRAQAREEEESEPGMTSGPITFFVLHALKIRKRSPENHWNQQENYEVTQTLHA